MVSIRLDDHRAVQCGPNEIILNNVSASSGGGFFTMDGAIISTNTLGNIHVNGGLGAVTIDNETGIPVVVQNVSAGTNSLNSTVSSKVDIIDTNQPAASQHSLYVYQPGVGISTYRGHGGRDRGRPDGGLYLRVHVRDDGELTLPRPAFDFSGAPGQSHP